ncbi:MAG: hypothetical protein MUC63_01800, partial [Planctomycetes bacterium]|nr:hypothetical protein [Planctomycetota bacterium]
MKKVLIVVLGVLGLGALLGGFMVFRTMQANKLIKELSKFELPEWGFDGYVELVSLKFKPPKDGFTSTTKPSYLKTLTNQSAPLHEVRVQGDAVATKLAAIAKDASKPENVRCAAVIILAHQAADSKKKDEIITALVDAMQEKEGRVGECASVLAQ